MSLPTSFDAPERLLLLLVVAGLLGAYVLQQVRGRAADRRWASEAMTASVAPRRPGPLRHVPAVLLALALAATTAAYAEPREEQEVTRERATVVVALDTSTSMLAEDVAPDRFTAAKAAAVRFVDGLPDGFDVALVSFHGTASLQVAPTRDHAVVTRAIERLELSGGTALGDAVQTALDALATPEAEAAGAVVLLADGGSTAGGPLPPALERAEEAGVPISTIAYGTPDGVVVADGRTFRVPVDEQVLAEVAETTGGQAYTAATATELDAVYDGIRTRLTTAVERVDVSAPLVGLGLLLLAGGAAPLLLRR